MPTGEPADEQCGGQLRMATQPATAICLVPASQRSTGEVRYVARQPILNLLGRVHAYELLFRNAPETVFNRDSDTAARTMLDNAVIFGLEMFTNGLPAFVSCTMEAVTEQLVHVLSPKMTVLAVPASLEQTTKLVEACRNLKDQGFRIALDGFPARANLRALLNLADYIRVDVTQLNAEARLQLRRINCASIVRVAMKVDTPRDYQRACAEGFTLFQGNYFCHPVLLKKHKIPTSRLFHFEIVKLLHHEPIDVRKVSQLVMRDASLTFRLLRLVNSPICAIQQEVRSVEAAILVIGEETFRRVVSLAVLSELNSERPPEILQMTLLRARFCELASPLFGLDPAEQYLLGMLSLVPAMLCLPMEDLIPSLPLRDRICEALQGVQNPERSLLSWMELHERGDWEACDAIVQANQPGHRDSTSDLLIQCYADAVVWAEAGVRSAV
jgi:EAL and modified HD-GYP domain-containing signal transduction protein